jgi:hypothetical protein
MPGGFWPPLPDGERDAVECLAFGATGLVRFEFFVQTRFPAVCVLGETD